MISDIKKETVSTIVIPCLNEEEYLAATCASLGFGPGIENRPSNTVLFIIDNGSSDRSVEIAEYIKQSSDANSVFVVFCGEKGYVPARRYGNMMVSDWAKRHGIDSKKILVLQADADTMYSDGYVSQMVQEFNKHDGHVLLQARSEFPPEFSESHSRFVQLATETDTVFCDLFPDESYDCIIDDKAAGYSLYDYFIWGGHRSEYISNNEEIYAETSRLFISAKTFNAKRIIVSAAYVQHSVRNVLRRPVLYFSTLGFPRQSAWVEEMLNVSNDISLNQIFQGIEEFQNSSAVLLRKIHVAGLFIALPIHIRRTLCGMSPNTTGIEEWIIAHLPIRTIEEMRLAPAIFLIDVFDLMQTKGLDLLQLLEYELKR